MKHILIGRTIEKAILNDAFESVNSQFVAITGRRRVGKTYLVRALFKDKIDFDFSGILNAPYQQQLQNFYFSLSQHFKLKKKKNAPQSWLEAFQVLSKLLKAKNGRKKRVIFIDELPWLDTHRSNFMIGLQWFWNNWASMNNVLLIVCGSATSWMINKLINNKGGLHNRITKRIHLSPFQLCEVKEYLIHYKVSISNYQIIQIYMALGGIPHYLKEIRTGESAMQAINRICFNKNGLLVNEFDNLYKALFKNYKNYEKVVHALATKMKGLTRHELISITKLKDGGTLTNILGELEWCDFISTTKPFGKKKKEMLYRLQDEYSAFYLKFIRQKKNVNWKQLASSQSWKSWSGFAFENVCLKHVNQIKRALGISGVYTETSSFSHTGTKTRQGAQIDLLIDRSDNVINMCEAKFYDKPFALTKSYTKELKTKLAVFEENSGSLKTLFPTIISTYGVIPNEHSIGFIQQEVKMDDLFKESFL